MDKKVEVVGVTRATDFISGETIFSVQFGVIGDRQPRQFDTTPPAIGVMATIFVPFEQSAPYLVGSEWILSVDEKNGTVSLRPNE